HCRTCKRTGCKKLKIIYLKLKETATLVAVSFVFARIVGRGLLQKLKWRLLLFIYVERINFAKRQVCRASLSQMRRRTGKRKKYNKKSDFYVAKNEKIFLHLFFKTNSEKCFDY